MNYELTLQLKNAGFPQITRWEVENNYRRTVTASGQESLPPLGALLSEINFSIGLDKHGKNDWTAYRCADRSQEDFDTYTQEKMQWLNKEQEQNFDTYRDDRISNCFVYSTPEEAVAELWLALNKK